MPLAYHNGHDAGRVALRVQPEAGPLQATAVSAAIVGALADKRAANLYAYSKQRVQVWLSGTPISDYSLRPENLQQRRRRNLASVRRVLLILIRRSYIQRFMTMYFWPVFAQFYAFLFSRSFFFSKPTGLPKSYDSDLILLNAAIFEIIEMAILCLNDNDTNHDLAMLKKSQGGLFLASLRTSSDDHIPDKVDNNVSGIMTIFCLRFRLGQAPEGLP